MIFKAKNKDGIEVEYSFELSRDLVALHGISASDIIENIWGTEFDISRQVEDIGSSYVSTFVLSTNDARDAPISWKWAQPKLSAQVVVPLQQ